jgi:NAD(P)H-hydrate epimerase
MRKVLTAAEMREVDRLTTETYGIPSMILMENAAHAAARVIAGQLGGDVAGSSVLVLCGKGNNGGDGAALARILWTQGADVEVVLLGLVADTKADARMNFEILQRIAENESLELDQADLAFEEITSIEEWYDYDAMNFQADEADVIVDALFGTGLTRPLEGVYEQAAAFIYSFNAGDGDDGPLIVSLDVPSGIDADRGEMIGTAPCADVTVTFTAPKLANVLPPAANFSGELFVEHIGSPCELVAGSPSMTFLAEAADAGNWLERTEFSPSSYKNRRGHALVIAGSKNYSGAAVLCGNSAIRSGVGLVTIATPESSRDPIAARVSPEVMVRGISEEDGAASAAAFDEIAEFWENVDVVAIGSGLSSTGAGTRAFVHRVVEHRRTPVVIDADGLNALSPFELKGSAELPLILTPHEGEFLRLLGTTNKDTLADRVTVAREFAVQHNVILLLKGERALVAGPDGKVAIIPTGNSGLGKAGNGDTLTGLVAGFAAQAAQMKIDMFETCVAAAYLGGLAGDIAEEEFGKRVMTASDVRDSLVEAMENVRSEM